jgi:hypothetical protein
MLCPGEQPHKIKSQVTAGQSHRLTSGGVAVTAIGTYFARLTAKLSLTTTKALTLFSLPAYSKRSLPIRSVQSFQLESSP